MDAVDGLILVCGIFILYQSIMMKKDGTIPEGVFLSKGTIISSTADVEGYIRDIFPKAMILGLLGAGSGACGLMGKSYPEYDILFTMVNIAFLVWLIVFLGWIRRAQKKYLK